MNKLLMIIPLVILFCFAFGCQQQSEEVTEEVGVKALSDEDVAAIKALGPALDKSALAGDWDAVASLFTEDVVMMGPNSPIIQGRSTLLEVMKSSGMTVTEHVVELVEVDGYGDIAYGRATWKETFSIEGVAEPIKEEGKILGIFRKQPDNSWLIAVWMWNSDLPLPE
jgi:uncharacterized protein (TIGR02246 family)